jgi:helix-turn-helix protein
VSAVRSDTGPFTIVPEWLLDAEISDRALRLYAVLGRYADRNGRAHPTRRRLAERLRCSLNSLDRARQELEQAGALEIDRRFSADGDPTSSMYTLRRGIPTAGERGIPTGAAQNENQVERDTADAEASAAAGEVVDLRLRTAQGVVATVVDAFSERGVPIPSRHRGIIGRQAAELLESGFDWEAVVLACVTALRRGEPQNAHFVAGDLAMASSGQRITRREYERALQDEMELAGGGRRGAA